MKNKAFTLIELLVVVLIIGILAAIALPKYEKAVEKSRMTQGLAIADALKKSMDSYILTNGIPSNWTAIEDKLDVDPGGVSMDNAGNLVPYLLADTTSEVRRLGNFAYAAHLCLTYAEFVVAKFQESTGGSHTIEYVITYYYTPSNGWSKYYEQKAAAKVNLKPDFQAMGFSTN